MKLQITKEAIRRAKINSELYEKLSHKQKMSKVWCSMCVIAEAAKDEFKTDNIKVTKDGLWVGDDLYKHTVKSRMYMDLFDEDNKARVTTLEFID